MSDNGISDITLFDFVGNLNESSMRLIESINLNAMRESINLVSSMPTKLYDSADAYNTISQMLSKQYQNIEALSSIPSTLINSMVEIQTTLSIASALYDSCMIEKVARSFASLDITTCIDAIQKTLDAPCISMSDYSFIKTSPMIRSVQDKLSYPQGFATVINKFNVGSANQLAGNKNIEYRHNERAFFKGDIEIDVSELNAICSAVNLLEAIDNTKRFSEDELIDFMFLLDNAPTWEVQDPTGQKIKQAIQDTQKMISLGKEYYYHSRPRNINEPPYVWQQMLDAPYGLTAYGRYNKVGHAHFYFTDTLDGSVSEIRKQVYRHNPPRSVIQTMMISARNPVNILDLSAPNMRRLDAFFKCLRMPLNGATDIRPRVYLIPNYVTQCCIMNRIDGIKFYGGSNYSNYVTWSDGHFEFARNIGDSVI